MKYEVPADLDGERLDKVVAVLGGISRSAARVIVERGEVIKAGEVVESARARVVGGETLEFDIPEIDDRLVPVEVAYGTVYRDEHILVVDKPSGLTVHPGAATGDETLAAGILFDHPSIEGVGQAGRWGIVHRLDRATSGLLVVALTDEAYDVLSVMMRAREVKRVYTALVQGVMAIPRGTVDAPIGPDPKRPTRRALSPYGKHAVTHYRRLVAWPDHDVSMLEVTLETGRTHQIRVHLSGIGNPVLGDRVYGGRDPVASPRLALHAAQLELHHPVTGEPMAFEAPLPPDLAGLVEELSTERLADTHG